MGFVTALVIKLLLNLSRRLIEHIKKLHAFENVADVVLVLFAGVDCLEECIIFKVVEVGSLLKFGSNCFKSLSVIEFELSAVGQSCTCLVTAEVNKCICLVDVLSPCTVEGDGCLVCTNKACDEVVNVVYAVFDILCIFSPHSCVLVGLHILCHFAVLVTHNFLNFNTAEDVEDKVKIMNTPVNKNTTAGLLLIGECTAKTGNRTECSEGAVYVVNVTELTVANADIKELALLFSFFSHFAGKLIAYCDGLFAENVLTCS